MKSHFIKFKAGKMMLKLYHSMFWTNLENKIKNISDNAQKISTAVSWEHGTRKATNKNISESEHAVTFRINKKLWIVDVRE